MSVMKFVLVCAFGLVSVQTSDLSAAGGYGFDGNSISNSYSGNSGLVGNGYTDGSSYNTNANDLAHVSTGYENNDYGNSNYGYGSSAYQVQEIASNSIAQAHSGAQFVPSAVDITHDSLNAGQNIHGGSGSGSGGDIQSGYGSIDYGNAGYSQSNYEVAPAVHTHEQAIPIAKHVEITKSVPYPVYKQLHVPVQRPVGVHIPHPVLVPVPHAYPIHIPVSKPVAVPVIKEITIPVEKVVPYPVYKKVPYPVEKHVPYHVDKYITVHKQIPYPVKVPIVKTIVHRVNAHHGHSHGWN